MLYHTFHDLIHFYSGWDPMSSLKEIYSIVELNFHFLIFPITLSLSSIPGTSVSLVMPVVVCLRTTVLLRTTQYHAVLLRTPCCFRTTPYCFCTTHYYFILLRTTPYYFVLLDTVSVLLSTTSYHSVLCKTFPFITLTNVVFNL